MFIKFFVANFVIFFLTIPMVSNALDPWDRLSPPTQEMEVYALMGTPDYKRDIVVETTKKSRTGYVYTEKKTTVGQDLYYNRTREDGKEVTVFIRVRNGQVLEVKEIPRGSWVTK